jgi:hypothetical protein
MNRGYCWLIDATITSNHTIARMTLEIVVAFDTIVASVIPLVTRLTSTPVIWREECLWSVSVLQIVRLYILVLFDVT